MAPVESVIARALSVELRSKIPPTYMGEGLDSCGPVERLPRRPDLGATSGLVGMEGYILPWKEGRKIDGKTF